MRVFYERNETVIRKILFLVGFVLFVYIFLKYLFAYVAPFVFGYVISLILNPAVNFLKRRCKIPRGLSALILIVVCLVLILVLGTSLASRIGREVESFGQQLPERVEQAKTMIEDMRANVESLIEYVPEGFRESFDKMLVGLGESLTAMVGSSVRHGSMGLVTRLPNALMTLILTIISAFFFIKDKQLIHDVMMQKTPESLKRNLRLIRKGLFGALGGYVKAQLIIMSVTTSIALLGLVILQSPYALLMGLVIGFIDAIPVFGSGFILWPWIVLELLGKQYPTAIGLAIIYGSIFITRQMMEPKVLGQQIGLHPLLTLMSMYAGVRVFGVLGFLVGPVIVLVIKVVMQAELKDDAAPPMIEETKGNI